MITWEWSCAGKEKRKNIWDWVRCVVSWLCLYFKRLKYQSIRMDRVEGIKRILRGRYKQVTEYPRRFHSSLCIFYELFICFKSSLINLLWGLGQYLAWVSIGKSPVSCSFSSKGCRNGGCYLMNYFSHLQLGLLANDLI